jgi:hypothetical protein
LFGDDSLDEREVVGVDGSKNILLILLLVRRRMIHVFIVLRR